MLNPTAIATAHIRQMSVESRVDKKCSQWYEQKWQKMTSICFRVLPLQFACVQLYHIDVWVCLIEFTHIVCYDIWSLYITIVISLCLIRANNKKRCHYAWNSHTIQVFLDDSELPLCCFGISNLRPDSKQFCIFKGQL